MWFVRGIQETNAGILPLILMHSDIATMAIQTVILNPTAISLPSKKCQSMRRTLERLAGVGRETLTKLV